LDPVPRAVLLAKYVLLLAKVAQVLAAVYLSLQAAAKLAVSSR
jgi:hypothetical protein